MGINFLKPTNTQATRKTVRGMVAKNLIALMLTGHPLGLIENMIHTPIDWIINKKFCTDSKLFNMGVHVVTCMGVDSFAPHDIGNEIAETLMSDEGGHSHGSAASDVAPSPVLSLDELSVSSDVGVDVVADTGLTDVPDSTEGSGDNITSEVSQPIAEQSTPPSNKLKALLQAKAQEMSRVLEISGVDGYDASTGQFAQMYQAADAQGLIDHTGHNHAPGESHAGHSHGDGHIHDTHVDHAGHDHKHGGHGLIPVLGGAIVEEYGPNMYKITKQRTQYLWDRIFNLTPASDTTIVKKSELATLGNKEVSKPKGRQIKFEPNIMGETQKQSGPKLMSATTDRAMAA